MPRHFECYTYNADSYKNTNNKSELPLDFAVAMGTPVSSVVRNSKEQNGNAGAHAEALAKRLGTRVVAYQDLGPKVSFPDLRAARNQMAPKNFPEYAAEATEALAGYISKEGIKKVAFRIHSGNGPLGTQLALNLNKVNQAELQVTHAAISDPAGIKEVPTLLAGFRLWLNYRRTHEKLMPVEQRADSIQPPNTMSAFIKDIYVRGDIWRTETTFKNLIAICNDTDITTLLYLPGKTFNGTPDAIQDLAAQWPERDADKPPFCIEYAPDGYHGTTYDSFAYNEAFVRRTIELAPFRYTDS